MATKIGPSFLDTRSQPHPIAKAKREENIAIDQQQSSTEQISLFNSAAKLVNWSNFEHIFVILKVYGHPSFLFSTSSFIIIGTSKGYVLIFDYEQILQSILIPKQSSTNYLRLPVELIKISSDGTYIAASYSSGDIFIWNLNDDPVTLEKSHVTVTNNTTQTKCLLPVLYIDYHRNSILKDFDFIHGKHTSLIVANMTKNSIVHHKGHRDSYWNLVYSTNKFLLNKDSEEDILLKSVYSVSGDNNNISFVTILTTKSLKVFKVFPNLAQIYYQELNIGPNVMLTNADIVWSPDKKYLMYSLNNLLFYLRVTSFNDQLIFIAMNDNTQNVINFDESILSLRFISSNILYALTVSHQLFFIDISSGDFEVIFSLDLLIHEMLIPPNKFLNFNIINNSLLIMTNYSLSLGSFISWSDLILSKVQKGDYLSAIKYFEYFLKNDFSLAYLLKLDESQERRKIQLKFPFYNLSLAAIKYLLSSENDINNELFELLSLILNILSLSFEYDKNDIDMNLFLEQIFTYFNDYESKLDIFYKIISLKVSEGSIKSLTPTLYKAILEFASDKNDSLLIENIMINLNLFNLDVDLGVRICKTLKLFDSLILITNKIFDDYLHPIIELLNRINNSEYSYSLLNGFDESFNDYIFDYLGFVLTGKQYPYQTPIPETSQYQIKGNIYYILLSGTTIKWPNVLENNSELVFKQNSNQPAFPYLSLLFLYNPKRFLSMWNEVFEDSFLSESSERDISTGSQTLHPNRQYIVDTLLDLQTQSEDTVHQTLICIFIARNYAKYPQFIKLSDQILDNLIETILENKEQELLFDVIDALESLMASYTPKDLEKFIIITKSKKQYTSILFKLYLKTKRYKEALMLSLCCSDNQSQYITLNTADTIKMIVASINNLKEDEDNIKEHELEVMKFKETLETNFTKIIQSCGAASLAAILSAFDSDVHACIKNVKDEQLKLQYLNEIFSLNSNIEDENLKKMYINLSCKSKDGPQLLEWLKKLDYDIVDCNQILNNLQKNNNSEGMAIVHLNLREYDLVIQDIIGLIKTWFLNKNRDFAKLHEYLRTGVKAVNSVQGDRKPLWVKLIVTLITIYSKSKERDNDRDDCNKALQYLFLGVAIKECYDVNDFWDVLTGVLEQQDVIMMKVSTLKDLFGDIFTTYELERHISTLLLEIINSSSLDSVMEYKNKLLEGWSIENEVCTICSKTIWGIGLNSNLFLLWEENRRNSNFLKTNVKDTKLVVFKCHHGFHLQCLRNLGQKNNKFFCLTCNNT